MGMNSVVMDGAKIGESSMVAAMSFVKAGMIIPDRQLVAGSPARIIREMSEKDINWKRSGTRDYQTLTKRSLNSMIEVPPLTEVEENRPRQSVAESVPLYKLKEQD